MTIDVRQRRRDRLRAVIFYGLMLVLVFVVVSNQLQSKKNGRLAAQVKTLIEERKANDLERTNLLKEVKAQGNTIKAQADVIQAQGARIEALALGQTAILEQVKVISQQVPNCFTPQGDCTRVSAAAAQRTQAQLNDLAARIQQFQFVVSGTVNNGQFQGTAQPTCQPVIGVGKVEVGGGVACARP